MRACTYSPMQGGADELDAAEEAEGLDEDDAARALAVVRAVHMASWAPDNMRVCAPPGPHEC